ncbi:MAG: hypothetical protein LBT92_03985 [Rickettsiales bacterium]|jgi:ribosomal 30S subunit maturation factor RimM|nr:hypothetical protein [Rickettsiales bacterium]
MTPIAKITSAHGIKGEVKISARVANILAYAPLFDADGDEIRIERIFGAICKIDGTNDRNAAEAMRGAEIYTESALSVEDDPAGLPVFAGGRRIGTVSAKLNFGAGDILEIKTDDGAKMISMDGGGVLSLGMDGAVIDPEHLV